MLRQSYSADDFTFYVMVQIYPVNQGSYKLQFDLTKKSTVWLQVNKLNLTCREYSFSDALCNTEGLSLNEGI